MAAAEPESPLLRGGFLLLSRSVFEKPLFGLSKIPYLVASGNMKQPLRVV
ncbi:hypothetical protein EV13_0816 [Prochlorococcus sp. MIT 0702]|nr:hypothetical protein EV12_0985 [Prochlorococcus sp. MIT 0701]KGG29885.1 hypothetical protein EV13_0816 [Prochlorococcus sp. MIT 0702]KGG34455.1 hypothetical protein EV14_1210 [Prochlorococcus sp. MIT 0703]